MLFLVPLITVGFTALLYNQELRGKKPITIAEQLKQEKREAMRPQLPVGVWGTTSPDRSGIVITPPKQNIFSRVWGNITGTASSINNTMKLVTWAAILFGGYMVLRELRGWAKVFR